MAKDLLIGSHVSMNAPEYYLGSVKEAISYGSSTFMFYTGAPQNSYRKPLNELKIEEGRSLLKEHGFDETTIVVHAPYIINLCNEDNFEFSTRFLTEELERVNQLGIKYMVLHPGSHVGLGIEKGIDNIVKGLNLVLFNLKDTNHVTILLETMAGKGSEVGSKLEELKMIIDRVEDKEHIGVCLDTCHLNDAGYDMSNFDSFLKDFDQIIGMDKIRCIHINDSKNSISSHKDRHENIGFGTIGFDNLIKIIYHKDLENIPKILETPYVEKEFAPYKYEIEMIRNQKFDKDLLDKIKKQI